MPTGDVVEMREREVKFDVAPDYALPTLDDVVPEGGRVETATVHLTSTYLDTPSRDLLAAGVTLRRRVGDVDSGWQLKVPDGDARVEVRAELNGGGVPKPLRDLVLGLRTGDPLRGLATLKTERRLHVILAADGTRLAEIADDEVWATVHGPRRRASHWREIEVELAGGDEELLSRAGMRLVDAGAVPSASSSKLAHALQGPGHAATADLSLAGLIRSYVTGQVDALQRADVELRRGLPVVHATRVASRRLRSVLRIFGDVFDTERAQALDVELAWYAGVLGEVRDREVLLEHLTEALNDLPAAAVVGPVRERIESMLTRELTAANAVVARALVGQRYLALMRELKAWRDEPAFAGEHQPEAAVAGYVRAAQAKVHRRMRAAVRHHDTDEELHRARKAAKRARYAAELAVPTMGKAARAVIRDATRVQTQLGGMHDSVIASEFLLRAAQEAATGPGESALTFGILWEREQQRARASAKRARRRTG